MLRPARTPDAADTTLDAAVHALRSHRPEEAERLASGVLEASRGNVRAAQVLGQALVLQGRPGEAIAVLEKAARRRPDPVSETLLGRALALADRQEEALARLKRATGMRPVHAAAFLELGERLGELGRFDEAAEVFEQGLALTKGAVVLLLGRAHLQLKRRDITGALAVFEQAYAAAPERADVLAGLAAARMLGGEPALAADLYRRAVEAQPADGQSRINLAKCLLELGRREEGEAALRAAATAAPRLSGLALSALAAATHGRMFLRPSAASRFLRGEA